MTQSYKKKLFHLLKKKYFYYINAYLMILYKKYYSLYEQKRITLGGCDDRNVLCLVRCIRSFFSQNPLSFLPLLISCRMSPSFTIFSHSYKRMFMLKWKPWLHCFTQLLINCYWTYWYDIKQSHGTSSYEIK